MPPHCDALDGPVVTAARHALDAEDVVVVLPYVPATATDEIEDAFALTVKARAQGPEARDVADRWFFETVVRLHRAGEGAPFTGLKPAGLDVGPVIPVAEHAVRTGDPGPLGELLTGIVRDELALRFAVLRQRDAARHGDLEAERAYVSSLLGVQVWSHKLALAAHAEAHGDGHRHG